MPGTYFTIQENTGRAGPSDARATTTKATVMAATNAVAPGSRRVPARGRRVVISPIIARTTVIVPT